jgi:hypothetical protein
MSRDMRRLLIGVTLLIVFSFSIRYANSSHEPTSDELYHVLAAASWSESGSFAIADGEYTRAHIFTRLIGVVYGATDGDLDAIRLLCILIGSLLVVAVFFGVRFLVGPAEAYVAAIMLSMTPGAIFLSQYIRFYSLHALAFWLAAIAVYALATISMRKSAKLVLCALVAMLVSFAIHLQITTIVGLVGLAIWLIAISVPAAWRRHGTQRKAIRIATVSVLGLILILCGVLLSGPLAFLLERFQTSSLWSADVHPGYYFIVFRNQFGAFWGLFPVAVLIALMRKPGAAFFCLCVFATAFIVHSFAAMRAERYLLYAMPFFVTIWGIAISVVSCQLYKMIIKALSCREFAGFRLISREVLSASVVAVSFAFLVLMTPATEFTVRMVLNKPASELRYWFYRITSWNSAKHRIKELVADSDVFLTSQAHHAIYYIGDFDVEISASGLSDFRSGRGGSDIDPRTGRRVVADGSALQEIVSCNDSGVVVVDRRNWRVAAGVNDEAADVIERNMNRVEIPQEWGMLIYRWSAGDTVVRAKKTTGFLAGLDCSR